jgi:hypothetical protein
MSKEVSKYTSVLVRVQDRDTELAGEYILVYGKANENNKLGTGIFVHKRIISAVES